MEHEAPMVNIGRALHTARLNAIVPAMSSRQGGYIFPRVSDMSMVLRHSLKWDAALHDQGESGMIRASALMRRID